MEKAVAPPRHAGAEGGAVITFGPCSTALRGHGLCTQTSRTWARRVALASGP